MSDEDEETKGSLLEDIPDDDEPSISDARLKKRKKPEEKDFEDLDSLAEEESSEAPEGGEASLEDIDKQLLEAAPELNEELAAVQEGNFSELNIAQEGGDSAAPAKRSKGLGFLKGMDRRQKMLLGSVLGILCVFIPLFIVALSGDLLPNFKIPYKLTLGELSDDVRTYDDRKAKVPLFDSFRTKAVTVQLPQIVISLKPKDDRPSYGKFEFSLSVRDEDYSKIIQQQQATVIDLIQRTMEQVTWDDLQSPMGKEKAKKIIRYRLNEALQGDIVIGVYYKSIILTK